MSAPTPDSDGDSTPVRPDSRYPDQLYSGWGDPAQAVTLPPAILDLLAQGLGVSEPGHAAPALDDIQLPESRLAQPVRARLERIVGPEQLTTTPDARVRHLRGKSTPDLLKLRDGDATDAPDAVVLPATHDEVQQLLEICSEERIAVTPFGGGTSVVGGLTPQATTRFAATIALDVRRLNTLRALDEISRTATLEPGLRCPEAEELLNARGYTIGHFPQSYEYLTIGGAAAARSSGQASAGYGRFDERVVGIKVATPRGTIELGRAPKSAAGPDLRQLFLGSEGAFGVITELTVEVKPVPTERVYDGWRFESFTQGATALRRLIQDGPVPTVLRLSDEAETALNLARPAEIGGSSGAGADTPGCLAIVGYEGTEEHVAERRERVTAILTEAEAGARLDAAAGESWSEGRYRAPYLRDALLDAGALVETLETVTFWSNLRPLYEAVGEALRRSLTEQGTPPVVLCHISHVYPSGASLYFTVAAAQANDPLSQWGEAKKAASDAIIKTGGSITHHHGIGVDHREHYAEQVGPLAIEALRAVKATLDPAGIMNPGVLIT
jgi:alkyldihydroxyacetonephosphate synthase